MNTIHRAVQTLSAGLLAVIILLTGEPVSAASEAYRGTLLIAVNTSTSDSYSVTGSFTASSLEEERLELQTAPEKSGVCDIYVDPVTGDTYYELEPQLPHTKLIQTEELSAMAAATYAVGDTKKVKSYYSTASKSMKCLYVGTHCTVWGNTDDDEKIQLNNTNAKRVADYFDGNYAAMTDMYGSYWKDGDNDGKIAIFCYDIKDDYPSSPSTYTAGYFFSSDYSNSNKADCIHIDTYPGMGGKGNEMGNVQRCFSTLFHEYQHLINYSYECKNGDSVLPSMESYLDEAFSMAAQHIICGWSTTSGRVSYFSGSSYVAGTSLTKWGGSLSNYANSFLFGQYIRVRYAQLGNQGETIYKKVLENRADSKDDTLALIASYLNTTEKKLIQDFWKAVALKIPSGKYGFNGESWADNIDISLQIDGTKDSIMNGGAKFYTISDSCTVSKSSNLAFFSCYSGECEAAVSYLDGPQWTVADGILYIFGAGDMADYLTDSPWDDCSNDIQSITVSDWVTKVGDGAFSRCVNAEQLSLGAALTDFSASIVSGCTKLAQVELHTDNESMCVQNGILFSADMTELLLCPAAMELTEYEIPDTVTQISPYAFCASGLSSLTINAEICVIGENAFKDCTQLTAVSYRLSGTKWGTVSVGSGNEALGQVTTNEQLTVSAKKNEDGSVDVIFYSPGKGSAYAVFFDSTTCQMKRCRTVALIDGKCTLHLDSAEGENCSVILFATNAGEIPSIDAAELTSLFE